MAERDFLKNRIKELDMLAYGRDIIKNTDFLDVREQSVYLCMKNELSARSFLYGGHEDADRRMAIFLPSYMDPEYPEAAAESCLSLIEAKPLSERFSDELSHRDFLGAIMNLGVERSKIGDILTDGTRAFIFVCADIAPFLCEELRRVKHTSIYCERVAISACDIRPRFEELKVNVASERADAVLAAVFKLSRETASALIEAGNVFSDGREISKPSAELRDGSRISVRGYGKFRYEGTENVTRKGRLYVIVKKYV